jgi:hypothetical protein
MLTNRIGECNALTVRLTPNLCVILVPNERQLFG